MLTDTGPVRHPYGGILQVRCINAQRSASEDRSYFTACPCEGEKLDCLHAGAPLAAGLLAAVLDSHHIAPECQEVCYTSCWYLLLQEEVI